MSYEVTCCISRSASLEMSSKDEMKQMPELTMSGSDKKELDIGMVNCLAYGTVANPGGVGEHHTGGGIYERV